MKVTPRHVGRISREKRTVSAMIRLYCRHHHSAGAEGCSCNALERYAHARLDRCPHGEGKPSCRRCTIHCYSPSMRRLMQEVMRWSGPRMVWRHPLMALRHLWDDTRR
ncbi:MAG TPA: nitrous oxide-stimulated promoter family protein [Candidatus Amulumruptor caecigallinarius]|uniref:Nitrous oxide-stimulated promoter family protein n=1 Tax=Candidatus Amulumruptor caecigallinarius TaxID=2109911 RepID=A0A921E6K7_9BACT|nr:nitrous oxide-stimulated promoter family protein [Candidatus Amulumruptor caecigallinarius]